MVRARRHNPRARAHGITWARIRPVTHKIGRKQSSIEDRPPATFLRLTVGTAVSAEIRGRVRRHTVFCITFQQKVANTRQLRVPAAKEIEDTLHPNAASNMHKSYNSRRHNTYGKAAAKERRRSAGLLAAARLTTPSTPAPSQGQFP